MVRIRPRSDWNARRWRSRRALGTPTTYADVHHVAARQHHRADIRRIQDYHMDVLGWTDIFYNFPITRDGQVWMGRGPGIASGAGSHNVLVMGHFGVEHPSDAQIISLIALLTLGVRERWWLNNIRPHSARAATACPDKNMLSRLPYVRSRVSAILAGTTTPPSTGGFLMSLSAGEQRELLSKVRKIDNDAMHVIASVRDHGDQTRLEMIAGAALLKQLGARKGESAADAIRRIVASVLEEQQ
jgi:hypothetical protein